MSGKPTLRQLWDGNEPMYGGWCSIPNSFTAEIMARTFDWVCVDMQHGLTGQDALISMLQSISITGTPAFVRVPWNEPGAIMRSLDAGAQGVIVPMVNSVAEARRAVAAARYAPEGFRSWGPTRSALYSSLSPTEVNRSVICTIMVETIEAVDALDEILEVDGLDAVFVGPSDLAVSIGVDPARAADDTRHNALLMRVAEVCQAHKIVAGIMCTGAESAIRWRDSGFRMLAIQSDARLLRSACDAVIEAVRQDPGSGMDTLNAVTKR